MDLRAFIAVIVIVILSSALLTNDACADNHVIELDGQSHEWDTYQGKYVDTRWREYTEAYAYVITVADWLQTRQIQDVDGVYEKNSFICGKQPSSDCVAAWMLAKMAGVWYINHYSDWNPTTKYRFNVFYGVSHTHAVYNNLEIGLEIQF